MRIIIAGSRTFDDYELMRSKLDQMFALLAHVDVTIVSGGAEGADKLGERYAKEKGYSLIVCHANWTKHGRSAGPIRNKEMAEISNALALFWDGKSSGSASMKKEALLNNLEIQEVIIQNTPKQ